MTRDKGERIVSALLQAGEGIDLLDAHISTLADKDLQKSMRRSVGAILAANYDLMSIVMDQYPELDRFLDN